MKKHDPKLGQTVWSVYKWKERTMDHFIYLGGAHFCIEWIVATGEFTKERTC
ncbi:hypothetical protein [Neobacillus sp. NPDC093127]|uniref:hypothetical protein n=1 Tax=Neobacillus sp. NPDC093127 TaxID=3364296 RepID=UPI00380235C5